MTDFINTAEAGVADETDATTANVSAGPAGSGFTVDKNGAAVFKFDNAAAAVHRGSLGYRMSAADLEVSRAVITLTATGTAACSLFAKVAAYPLVEETILAIRTASAQAIFCNITAAGLIRLYDNAGTAIWISTNPVPLNAWWRASIAGAKGTTTANGTVRCAVFHGAQLETATPTEFGPSATPTARNAGTVDFTLLRIGKVGSGGALSFTGVDDIQWSDTRSDHIPPPTGALPVNSFTKTSIVEVDASATSGSPTGQTLTRTSGPSVTITGPVAGLFRVVLPDPLASAVAMDLVSTNGAGSDTDVVTVNPTGGSITNIIRDDLYYTGTTPALA